MKRKTIIFLLSLAAVISPNLKAQARVKVYSSVDQPYVLAGQNNRVTVKVGLSGIAPDIKINRLPMNVAVVLDKSGSMASENRIERAKQGAIEVVQRLDKADIFSLIVYDSRPRVYIPAQPVENKEYIISLIRNICPGGNTALYGGVETAYAELCKNLSDGYINRIVLLSDGLANVGPSSAQDLAFLGSMVGEDGISVSTVGVGLDYNEDLMTALAGTSGGNSYFAANSDQVPMIFAEEIGEAMALVGRRIKVYLDCPRGVRPLSVLGREGKVKGNSMEVSIDNLYGTGEKFALFEVEVPAHKEGKKLALAKVEVEYLDPFSNKTIREKQKVEITVHEDKALVENKKDKGIVKETALLKTAEMKEEAIALADEGKYDQAAVLFEQRSAELAKVAEQCDNDTEISEEAEACASLSKDIISHQGFTRFQRKAVKSEAFGMMNQQSFVPQNQAK